MVTVDEQGQAQGAAAHARPTASRGTQQRTARHRTRWWGSTRALGLSLALCVSHAPAFAQRAGRGAEAADGDQTAEARRLFKQGVALAQQERWREAAEAFSASRALVERPSTIFNLAGALYRLGRLVEARETFEAYLEVAPRNDRARTTEAKRMVDVLRDAIVRLTLRVEPDDAEVTLDGQAVAGTGEVRVLVMDPGDHTLEVSADGFVPRRLPVNLAEAERGTQTVRLERVPEAPLQVAAATDPMPVSVERRDDDGGVLSSPWFWVVTGVVVAGGATAAYLLLQSPDPAPADGGNAGTVLQGLTF